MARKELGTVGQACNPNTRKSLRKEDHELKPSLHYTVKPCLKK
jgi:hypothetical protein